MSIRSLLSGPALAFAVSMIGGCSGSPPTTDELAAADFGEPPTDPEPALRRFFENRLKDPESARYRIGTPVKGYFGKTLSNLAGPRNIRFGWLVPTEVNAKNSFGGYVGFSLYHCWFRGDQLVEVYDTNKILHQVEASEPLPER